VYFFYDYLRHFGYEVIFSPFESDFQLAEMFKKGQVQLIYSEDSDFLVYDNMRLVRKLGPKGEVDIFDHKKSLSNLIELNK
jgi:5'-3' exonuclease